jgi:hypothetical protein
MIPSLSYGSSSGVSGDTKSGPLGDLYFSTPFAVGSAANATAAQTGAGSSAKPPVWLWAIAGGLVLLLLLVIRRK